MNESIFVRLPGISSSLTPNYTEYGTKGTEALTPEMSSTNTRFFDLELEGYAGSQFYEDKPVKYVAAFVEVVSTDSPYFPTRDTNTSLLPLKRNYRFRGIKESEKFLLFNQNVAGEVLRERKRLETADLTLTTAEELLYPTDSDISSFYNATAQLRFHEWRRLRKFDARWLI